MARKFDTFKRIVPGIYEAQYNGMFARVSKSDNGWKVEFITEERDPECNSFRDSERRYIETVKFTFDGFATMKAAQEQARFEADSIMVEETNLMSGKKYMVAINVPYFCRPSSETYWSM